MKVGGAVTVAMIVLAAGLWISGDAFAQGPGLEPPPPPAPAGPPQIPSPAGPDRFPAPATLPPAGQAAPFPSAPTAAAPAASPSPPRFPRLWRRRAAQPRQPGPIRSKIRSLFHLGGNGENP